MSAGQTAVGPSAGGGSARGSLGTSHEDTVLRWPTRRPGWTSLTLCALAMLQPQPPCHQAQGGGGPQGRVQSWGLLVQLDASAALGQLPGELVRGGPEGRRDSRPRPGTECGHPDSNKPRFCNVWAARVCHVPWAVCCVLYVVCCVPCAVCCVPWVYVVGCGPYVVCRVLYVVCRGLCAGGWEHRGLPVLGSGRWCCEALGLRVAGGCGEEAASCREG